MSITLEQVENRRKQAGELLRLIDFIQNEDTHIQEIEGLKDELGPLTGIPAVFSKLPSFPIDETPYREAESTFNGKKKFFFAILGVTAVCLLIFFMSNAGFFNTVSVIGTFASIFMGVKFSTAKKAYNEEKKKYEDSLQKHLQSYSAFEAALKNYDREKEEGIKSAEAYGAAYHETFKVYAQKKGDYYREKTEAMEQFEALEEEYDNDPNFAKEYDRYLTDIASMMRSGRADSYKEALNMAIQEEREQQAEMARRAEEARRIAALERQAEEERRHNMELERQQAAHDRAMEQQAQNQLRLQKQQEAAMQREAMQARSVGSSKCSHCANRDKCPNTVKRNGGGINCGGYRPGSPR